MLKQICALPWFDTVCRRCNQIGKWFRNHHLPAGLLKRACDQLKIKVSRPVKNCATRFASWVYVVERIARLKRALRVVVDSPTYISKCLKKKGRDDDDEDKEPTDIINDVDFWLQVDKFLGVLVPIRIMLRYTDTRFSLACRVYEKFSTLCDKVKGLKLEAGFSKAMRGEVLEIVEAKWEYIHHDVHAAGYALDPSNILVDISANTEVWDGFMNVLDRLCTPAQKKEALIELVGSGGVYSVMAPLEPL